MTDFDQWWSTVWLRVGKGHARKEFPRALKKVDFDTLMSATARACVKYETAERRYTPHPSSWLSGERWEDEDLPPLPGTVPADFRAPTADELEIYRLGCPAGATEPTLVQIGKPVPQYIMERAVANGYGQTDARDYGDNVTRLIRRVTG